MWTVIYIGSIETHFYRYKSIRFGFDFSNILKFGSIVLNIKYFGIENVNACGDNIYHNFHINYYLTKEAMGSFNLASRI